MLDRVDLKREAKGIVKSARVSAYRFSALVLVISLVVTFISNYVSLDDELAYSYSVMYDMDLSFLALHRAFPSGVVLFVSIACTLLMNILYAGQIIYHLGIRRGEEMPYESLFDGFSFAGKVILLNIVQYIFVFLWTLLAVIPGIIAAYRYRFAIYNLCENPDIGVMEAIRMSKAQTKGFKWQLFVLDLSFIGWKFLISLTLDILSIWIGPYILQTDMGYFQQCKAITGVGFFPDQQPPDDTFIPQDPFDPQP